MEPGLSRIDPKSESNDNDSNDDEKHTHCTEL